MNDLQRKKVLVVGLGGSGLAAANFLAKRGARVTVTDIKSEQELQKQVQQLHPSVHGVLGAHKQEDFDNADVIVLSPGVPAGIDELKRAAEKGIPIYAEVELAYWFLKGKIIGVTGSNGKTTTTSLIGRLFKNSGKEHVVAGNISPEQALTRFIEKASAGTTFVVELSSFQLETIEKFKCDIALLLNITPDHLDRYARLEDYINAKERIFLNQTADDFAVLNTDNEPCMRMAPRRQSQLMLFSRKQILSEGVFVQDGNIRIHWKGAQHCLMPIHEIRLKGNHNLENVLAAAAAGCLSGLDLQTMADTFRTFEGVEHRLELVRSLDGIDFYNDSKATNVDSAYQALTAFDQPLIVIMGGKDKGGDFSTLRDLISQKVKLLILIGAATEKIFAALGSTVPTARAKDMKDAVEIAYKNATNGDAILLSPACASFDMFENYEHRGRVFKEAVMELDA